MIRPVRSERERDTHPMQRKLEPMQEKSLKCLLTDHEGKTSGIGREDWQNKQFVFCKEFTGRKKVKRV